MTSPFRLSVAVPVHDEEAVLPELLRRVSTLLDTLDGGPHEIVLVDDGSTDQTWSILEQASCGDPRLIVIRLSRNFGHQAALAAALDHVSGDAIVLMDADLQDRPEAIRLFLEKYREGFDVVYAKRVRRKETWWLRVMYYLFYRLLARVSDMRLPLDAGDFGLISSRVAAQIRKMPEHHRYLRGLRSWVGFRQVGVEVERDQRYAGASKYNLVRLVKLGTDGIFAFSTIPIRTATALGAIATLFSCLYALYSVVAKVVFNQPPRGFTALVTLISFMYGVQLIFFGIIGEYVGRIYEEVKSRPLYIICKVMTKGEVTSSRNAL
jgi:glycosyltransferase involved in cell wall biosynthesis